MKNRNLVISQVVCMLVGIGLGIAIAKIAHKECVAYYVCAPSNLCCAVNAK